MENDIFNALLPLFSMINRTDRDKKMLEAAGIQLEAAAFRVFGGIAHLQQASVGDLAVALGKSYSSISRQIDKLESEGLVRTYPSSSDSRVRVSELTQQGQALNETIRLTRQHIMEEAMEDWTNEEKKELLTGLTRLFKALERVE